MFRMQIKLLSKLHAFLHCCSSSSIFPTIYFSKLPAKNRFFNTLYNQMFEVSMKSLRPSPQKSQNKPLNWKEIASVFFEYLNDPMSCRRAVALDFSKLCRTTFKREPKLKNCQICRFRKAIKVLKIFPQRITTRGLFAQKTHQTASIYSTFKNIGPAPKFGHFWRFSE